jgi:hypothetical protein
VLRWLYENDNVLHVRLQGNQHAQMHDHLHEHH